MVFSAMAKALGAAIIKTPNKLGYDQMKPEQQALVEQFVSGRDVFGILRTGFGKSLCFGCLPLVFDEMLVHENASIIVIASHLAIAIMQDQVCTSLTMW